MDHNESNEDPDGGNENMAWDNSLPKIFGAGMMENKHPSSRNSIDSIMKPSKWDDENGLLRCWENMECLNNSGAASNTPIPLNKLCKMLNDEISIHYSSNQSYDLMKDDVDSMHKAPVFNSYSMSSPLALTPIRTSRVQI